MSTILLVARRELLAFLLSPLGYWIVALVLCLHGLWFNVVVMQGEQKSSQVVEGFFFHSSGFVAVVAVLLSMRLFAEERQTGTIVLLQTSPASQSRSVRHPSLQMAFSQCWPLGHGFSSPHSGSTHLPPWQRNPSGHCSSSAHSSGRQRPSSQWKSQLHAPEQQSTSIWQDRGTQPPARQM